MEVKEGPVLKMFGGFVNLLLSLSHRSLKDQVISLFQIKIDELENGFINFCCLVMHHVFVRSH